MTASTSTPVRVLVVDDDEIQLELSRQRLEAAGLKVDVRLGPFGSLAQIRSGEHDVVLLDVDMPALSGPQIAEIVAEDGGARPRVILYSSMDETALAQLKVEGVDARLSKSADKQELVDLVRRLGARA